MELTEQKKREYIKRLLLSRMRILCENGFYGLLLMHATFGLDEAVGTAATDGKRIVFCPSFLDTISDSELDFVLMHEILHIVLKHCKRAGERDQQRYNIACDIVVNSNILKSNNMDLKSISLKGYGALMHIAPDGREGFLYTAEEVYEMLPKNSRKSSGGGGLDNNGLANSSGQDSGKERPRNDATARGSGDRARLKREFQQWDNHEMWQDDEAFRKEEDNWDKYFSDACEAVSRQHTNASCKALPAFAERILEERKSSQVDWRIALNEFVQENVSDYSFSPPDKRFEGPFFLPDFNDIEQSVSDILFMVDASGSMKIGDVSVVFAEIQSAVEMFNGKLSGWVGFFDMIVYGITPFSEGLPKMNAKGGGGTSFFSVFDFVKTMPKKPSCIVILTDGFAVFPPESSALGIPVLWILKSKINPPWGKKVYITTKQR